MDRKVLRRWAVLDCRDKIATGFNMLLYMQGKNLILLEEIRGAKAFNRLNCGIRNRARTISTPKKPRTEAEAIEFVEDLICEWERESVCVYQYPISFHPK